MPIEIFFSGAAACILNLADSRSSSCIDFYIGIPAIGLSDLLGESVINHMIDIVGKWTISQFLC